MEPMPWTKYNRHLEQIQEEAVKWARDVNGITDPAILKAYADGIDRGARDMTANLQLHRHCIQFSFSTSRH